MTTIVVVPSLEPTATRTPAPSATFTPLPTRAATPPRAPTRTATKAAPAATLAPSIWDARLDQLNVRYIPATVVPGQAYWRLTRADFWDEKENQGKHHIFVNVLDEGGNRIVGQRVNVTWEPAERVVIVTEDKPAPEYSANFPLDINHYPPWGTLGVFAVTVDGLPSDKVAGMGLPPKNRFVVYLLTFQRTTR